MKKYLLILMVFIAGTIAASAQLTNTKWKGIANIPDPYESVFDFRKDTLILVVDKTNVVETMSYQLRGDTLILVKLGGRSPCDEKSQGSFRITWKDGAFTLSSLKDDCPERAEAFVVGPWKKLKDE